MPQPPTLRYWAQSSDHVVDYAVREDTSVVATPHLLREMAGRLVLARLGCDGIDDDQIGLSGGAYLGSEGATRGEGATDPVAEH